VSEHVKKELGLNYAFANTLKVNSAGVCAHICLFFVCFLFLVFVCLFVCLFVCVCVVACVCVYVLRFVFVFAFAFCLCLHLIIYFISFPLGKITGEVLLPIVNAERKADLLQMLAQQVCVYVF
jgi:hypothetical protein